MNAHPGEERLNDWVDGLLESADGNAVRRHVEACAVCTEDVARLRRLLALTSELPRSIEPPAETWAAIADRTIDLGRRRREVLYGLRFPLAAAALVLIALGGVLAAFVLRDAGRAEMVVAVDEGPGDIALAALAAAESEYDRTFDGLLTEYRQLRPQLDTATVRVVDENLLIIEQALERARAALGADPSNRELPLLITDTHRKRIALVERAMRLSARSERSEA
jgi:hypothetical protein